MSSYDNFKLSLFCLFLTGITYLYIPIEPMFSQIKIVLEIGIITFICTALIYGFEALVLYIISLKERKDKNK